MNLNKILTKISLFVGMGWGTSCNSKTSGLPAAVINIAFMVFSPKCTYLNLPKNIPINS